MDRGHFQSDRTKSRSGFVLMVIVIAIGLMLLITALYMGTLSPFAPFEGTEADRYSDPNAYPWEEGHLFINKQLDGYHMGGRRGPFRAQPSLPRKLIYVTEVYDGDEPRGEIRLTIYQNGDAGGNWNADFRIGRRRYLAVAEPEERENIFMGNTAPLKIYEDENGKDRSRLYVITAGFFRLQELGKNNGVAGAAYLTAWIDKQYKAEGELAMPSFINGEAAIFYWGPVEPTEQ